MAESHFAVTQAIAAASLGVIRGTRSTAKDFPEAMHLKMFVQENDKLVLKNKCSSVAVGMCVLSAAHCLSSKTENFSEISARTPEGYDGKVEMSSIRTPEPWKGKNPNHFPDHYSDIAIARLSSRPVQALSLEDLAPVGLEDLINQPLQVAAYGDMYDPGDKEDMKAALAMGERRGAEIGELFLQQRELQIPHRIVGDLKGFQGLGDLMLGDHLDELKKAKETVGEREMVEAILQGNPEMLEYGSQLLAYEELYKGGNGLLAMKPNPSAVRPGDSGGPVFITQNGKRILVGIVEGMKTHNPAEETEFIKKMPDDGSVAVLIAAHRVWLLNQIEELKCFETKPAAPMSIREIK
ncbi:MAG: hypothetical protein AB7H97_21980 [Pseudobdellovibrionaceae bacterium]